MLQNPQWDKTPIRNRFMAWLRVQDQVRQIEWAHWDSCPFGLFAKSEGKRYSDFIAVDGRYSLAGKEADLLGIHLNSFSGRTYGELLTAMEEQNVRTSHVNPLSA